MLLFQEALLQFQSKLSTQLQLINRAQNKQLHTQQSAPSAAHALPLHPTPPMLPQGIETLSLPADLSQMPPSMRTPPSRNLEDGWVLVQQQQQQLQQQQLQQQQLQQQQQQQQQLLERK